MEEDNSRLGLDLSKQITRLNVNYHTFSDCRHSRSLTTAAKSRRLRLYPAAHNCCCRRFNHAHEANNYFIVSADWRRSKSRTPLAAATNRSTVTINHCTRNSCDGNRSSSSYMVCVCVKSDLECCSCRGRRRSRYTHTTTTTTTTNSPGLTRLFVPPTHVTNFHRPRAQLPAAGAHRTGDPGSAF